MPSPGTYKNKKIEEKHEIAAKLLITHTNQEVADILDVHRNTISAWKSKWPEFRELMLHHKNETLDEIDRKIRATLFDAINYLHKAVKQDEINSFGINSANSLLDRANIKTTEKLQKEKEEEALSREDIQEILDSIPKNMLKAALNKDSS